jgi:hypothetical protein
MSALDKDLRKSSAQESDYLSEKEIRGILDLAIKNQMKSDSAYDGKLQLRHLQEAAAQMGVSADQLRRAHAEFDIVKEEKRKRILKLISAMLALGLVFLLYWYNKLPKYYSEPIKVVFTHSLDSKSYPVREAERFGLNQEKIYIHITWLAIKKGNYNIQYKWTGPEDELIFVERYVLKPTGSSYLSWSSYSPKEKEPEGKWAIEVTLDKMIVGKYSFLIEKKLPQEILEAESLEIYKGEYSAVYTTKVDGSSSSPLDKITAINPGDTATAHIQWLSLSGKHVVKWRWIHESGDVESQETLTINPSRSTWNTWDPFTPKKIGIYKTKIYLDNALVTTLELKVKKK